MKQQTKVTLSVIVAVVIILGTYLAIDRVRAGERAEAAGGPQVVRADSHRLGETSPEGSVVVTEFLDFECEACGAAYPYIEQLRKEYAGRVTFVMRYFPGPSHYNARNAAHAVEAAAQQDQLEPMYSKMFQTQSTWGEARESKAALFRGFAQELGLDMAQYDADVASEQTEERVQEDFDEGLALGVEGTPTFFVDGEKVELQTGEELVDAIEAGLAERG